MTLYFIKKFKAGIFCKKCKGPGVSDRKMCNFHRAQARDRWRVWVPQRQAKGLCISCHRKPYQGFQRCKRCTLQNRAKCLKWCATHPERSHMYWAKKKQESRSNGTCVKCREKRAVYKPDALQCLPCLEKHREYNRSQRGERK